ncbi:hypothetical protein NPIL_25351 [Nephila pilipes]|uniref:Uncharacterized protein n=1 Tax=Nephila pilipes TaxID=299642 RepID=A0A8X6R3D9_NEPPI|nr:hypothetical protein NPIL_25351 [Nephila pilipes]
MTQRLQCKRVLKGKVEKNNCTFSYPLGKEPPSEFLQLCQNLVPETPPATTIGSVFTLAYLLCRKVKDVKKFGKIFNQSAPSLAPLGIQSRESNSKKVFPSRKTTNRKSTPSLAQLGIRSRLKAFLPEFIFFDCRRENELARQLVVVFKTSPQKIKIIKKKRPLTKSLGMVPYHPHFGDDPLILRGSSALSARIHRLRLGRSSGRRADRRRLSSSAVRERLQSELNASSYLRPFTLGSYFEFAYVTFSSQTSFPLT